MNTGWVLRCNGEYYDTDAQYFGDDEGATIWDKKRDARGCLAEAEFIAEDEPVDIVKVRWSPRIVEEA